MKIIKFFNIAFLLLLISPLCFADSASPVTQLQAVADKMISQLESNKTQLHQMQVIRNIVNHVLLPHVDLSRMSSAVVGREWRLATPAQREQFQKEFSYLVTTTYASALASYDGDKVTFQPLREDYAAKQTVRVSSIIVRKNGQRIPITYDVERNGNAWKVYDFSIEHVSMVQSYRSQFQGVLAQGGMNALLVRLKIHNRR
ncbi:MAG: hypothetical protein A3C44_06000 [Gammaproteobacteria bacterium RIFCSPHIGHO2_02_FULL_39_13]|nr:MAG: hypothetical protein A3C44_06000 [Gammaproteobacteria bacterium RIFCSPHIGHO2_02_FULL_39_13]OGT49357.1 MAG: hypothetical protein A3E53_07540 [Gammaproteobacteria bacterium RIFCSPHIGHO2_12_FULL_39_24]